MLEKWQFQVSSYHIIGFLIYVQVQGPHPHQWAPFREKVFGSVLADRVGRVIRNTGFFSWPYLIVIGPRGITKTQMSLGKCRVC